MWDDEEGEVWEGLLFAGIILFLLVFMFILVLVPLCACLSLAGVGTPSRCRYAGISPMPSSSPGIVARKQPHSEAQARRAGP